MKNKLLKTLSLCMILALVFSFAACSDKKDDVKDEAKKSSAEKTEELKSDGAVTSDIAASDGQIVSSAQPIEQQSPANQPVATQNEAKEEPQENTAPDTTVTEPAPAPQTPAPEPAQDNQSQETPGKYADAEIYEKDGSKYAKTEDGTEVEMSGENLQKMMEEYTKVQGSGSAKEKEILDKMQVILDNADKLAQK